MSAPRKTCTRRGFLAQVVAGGSLGLVGAAIGLPGAAAEPLPVLLGDLEAIPPGSVQELTEHGLILRRDAEGLQLLSARCTHLGCRVRVIGDELVCPCHEGRFALSGAVLGGPPREPLARLRVSVSAAGQVYYHPGEGRDGDHRQAHSAPRCAAPRRG